MQAMGTPIAVTTPNNAETGVIQPVSGSVATPFDELLALVAPNAATPSPEALALAGGENPTGSIPNGAATTAVSALPVMPFPAVQPLAAPMVNAADPAEADLAALMAASQLAMRGVAARAPLSDVPAEPTATQPVIAPEDFIGPMRPQGLTAEPAASALNSAELPEAAVAASLILAQDENFIGPVWPEARQNQVEAQTLEVFATETEARLMALQPPPFGGDVDRIAPRDETTLSPQPEALLQTQAQAQNIDQSIDEMALNASLNSDFQNPQTLGVVAAPMMISSDEPRDEDDQHALTEKTWIAAPSTDDAATKAAHLMHGAAAASDDTSLAALVSAANAQIEPTAHTQSEHDRAMLTDAAVPHPTLSAEAVSAVLHPLAAYAVQPHGQSLADQDRIDTPAPLTKAQSLPLPVATGQAKLTPDEALLRVMQHSVPAQTNEQIKAARDARTKIDASLQPRDAFGINTLAADHTPRESMTPQTILRTPDQALRQALALASQTQPLKDDTKSAELRQTETPAIDAKIAASIRDITVVQATAEAAQDKSLASAAAAPTPSAIMSDHGTRNAPEVAAINPDGRRDAKRDADIRQRQIEQQIHVALRAGIPEIRMQLYPPGLGQVMIRLALDGQKLRLSIKADQAEASDALMQTEAGLRDALTRDGYTLAGFDVHDQSGKNRHHRDNADSSVTQSQTADEKEPFSVDMTV